MTRGLMGEDAKGRAWNIGAEAWPSRLRKRLKSPAIFSCLVIVFVLTGCAARSAPVPSMLTADVAPAAPADIAPHEDMMNPIVLRDALTNIDALEKSFDWRPFRPGVEIARIYTTPDNGPSAAFLKYQPGASVPLHMHSGYEHIFILKGTQVDRSGEHVAGDVVINPPGSSHNVSSPNGCIVLIVWDKPVILAS